MARETRLVNWSFGVNHGQQQQIDPNTYQPLVDDDGEQLMVNTHTVVLQEPDPLAQLGVPGGVPDRIVFVLPDEARAMLAYLVLQDLYENEDGSKAAEGEPAVLRLLAEAHEQVLRERAAMEEVAAAMRAREQGLQIADAGAMERIGKNGLAPQQ